MYQPLSFATSVYDAVDSMDETKLAPFLTSDCMFIFGNAEPVLGREAAAEASKAFMAKIAGIKHEIVKTWGTDDHIITMLNVTYTRKDGKSMKFPAATIWRMKDTQIDEYRIYVDNAAVFAS